ncbi:HK97 gp10 family phage protein, partial [Myxococcus sp. CA039A]|uniref:HK97 gp10 family phage protein n=1 Tax=Myxococcus sp. CA039A TaxID=2741737 RepID=UPI00157B9F9C
MSQTKKTDRKVRKGASFARQVAGFVAVAQGRGNEVLRKTALGILANVVEGSPVDTGRFRGNWQVGVGNRPAGELEVDDKGGEGTVGKGAQTLESATLGDKVFITNNLPYARRLEWGHSAQAPRGMVRLALANLRTIMEEAVKEAKSGGGG